MGYEFHITRAEFWWESGRTPISQAEWEAVADAHPALLVSENSYVEWIDIGVQKAYEIGEDARLAWRHGKVDIWGRYTERVETVAGDLARLLNAKVQGDDP